ncbi:MAG TPA: ABC transporter substrate-binding protein [Streptosporangiaceae bacterium]
MRKHIVLSGSAAIALTAVLAACGGANNTSGPGTPTISPAEKGGTLTILDSQTTLTLDPAQSWSLAVTSSGLLWRRLTTWKIGPTGAPAVVPDLATSDGTPSDGGRVWTYHLKSGIYFSNGQPITSYDVKYGIERTYAAALSGGLNYQKPLIAGTAGYQGPFSGKELSSIVTPNSKTIIFHLNKPYGNWPWVVSTTSMAPVPEGKAPAATFNSHPITSGPYAVQSYTPGNSAILVRNKYWTAATDPNRSGGPSKIIWELNQDPTVEAQTLLADGPNAQNAFGADFVPPAQLAQVENNPSAKARLVTSPASPLEYVAVNVQSPKLKNLKVREALEYAVNRQAVVVASGGPVAADPATTLITPGIVGREPYNLYPAGTAGDPAKAKSLLTQAGAHNLTLTLATPNDPISTAISQAVQQAYSAAGIKVVIKSLSANAFSALATGNSASGYDLALSSWQPDFPSAMDNIEPLFASAMIGNGNYNISRLSDPKVDALINRAEGTINEAAAGKIWAQADKAIMADAAVVPLVYNRNSFLRGSNVDNFYIGEFPAYPVYTAVSLKQ